MRLGLGIGLKTSKSRSWTTPFKDDLILNLNSRTGSALNDSIGAEEAEILSIEHLSDGTAFYYGDKTRADEKLLDGNSHTFYCKIKQIADVSYVGTTDILCRLGRGTGTATTDRGISFPISAGIFRPYLSDGTVRLRPELLTDVNANLKSHEWVELFMQVDFANKLWIIKLYTDEGDVIVDSSIDISSVTFNANANTDHWTFKSIAFILTNIKSFNALKTIEQCRDDSYITNIRTHYPTLFGGTDVSGNSNHLSVTGDSIATRIYTNISTWALSHGYHFERSINHPGTLYRDYTHPYNSLGESLGFRITNIINEVDGNSLHNLVDSKIRFTNDFFDRSNATIWGDAARQNKFARIVVSGTGGTATVNINGVSKTMTFDTDIAKTVGNFVYENRGDYLAVGLMINNVLGDDYELLVNCPYEERLSVVTITNTTGDLAGTVTLAGYYDAANTKDFHISELNQRILMSWLNNGYKGRLYVHCESKNHDGVYQGSIEDRERRLLKGIYLYNTDHKGADQIKILTYTGDKLAALSVYDANGYVQLGHLKSKTPSLVISIDDGFQNVLTGWKPKFDGLGFNCPACTNVHGGNIGGMQLGVQLMTWEEIAQCTADGWEVGSHNYQDNDYSGMTFTEIEADVVANRNAIIAQGYPCKILVGNRTTLQSPTTHYMAWKYAFKASRNYGGRMLDVHGANPARVDKFHLSAMALQGGFPLYDLSGDDDSTAEKARVKAQLDIALADNRIVIFYFHGYSETRNLDDHIAECITYANTLGIPVLTTEEAIDNCSYQ